MLQYNTQFHAKLRLLTNFNTFENFEKPKNFGFLGRSIDV